MKVLAAVVTYNRVRLLERCIDHILGQTRPPEGLIVINNDSPYDTELMLKRRGINHITQPNVGGAGGFNRAISHALEQGYDAVWLMDDDGFPAPEALQHLAEELRAGVACVSSVVLREDNPRHFVFPYPVLDSEGMPSIFRWPRKIATLDELRSRTSGKCYPFAHLFNGALVALTAVHQIGNVETGFFIFGDEVDYLMRLRSAGAVLSHVDAHHFHPDVANRPLNDAKIYYYVKNTLILNRRYYNKPRLRNVLAVVAALGRMTARNGVGAGLSFAVGPRSGVIRKAIRRGLRGQVGNDFNG